MLISSRGGLRGLCRHSSGLCAVPSDSMIYWTPAQRPPIPGVAFVRACRFKIVANVLETQLSLQVNMTSYQVLAPMFVSNLQGWQDPIFWRDHAKASHATPPKTQQQPWQYLTNKAPLTQALMMLLYRMVSAWIVLFSTSHPQKRRPKSCPRNWVPRCAGF